MQSDGRGDTRDEAVRIFFKNLGSWLYVYTILCTRYICEGYGIALRLDSWKRKCVEQLCMQEAIDIETLWPGAMWCLTL
jgi:hypothetical protein